MFMSPTTCNEIILLIRDLDGAKSAGPDGIPVSFVKIHHQFFATLLAEVFNEIIETGIYPECLKTARVVPVFKNGDSTDLNNYRPISTLSILDKILEKLILKRILDYVTRHKMLYSYQYGFRKGSSTLAATCDLVDDIYDSLDSGTLVGALFIDLKKAFDTIDHLLLIEKLDTYGIRGVAKQLIRSYLTDRKQFVSIGEDRSTLQPITTGVPQGSILGPVLFLLFVNDVSTLPLNGKIRLFADDTSVFYRGPTELSIQTQMNHDLELLSKYFKTNVLSLNLSKTKYMLIHSPRRTLIDHVALTFEGRTVEKVQDFPFLGLTLDAKMTWRPHINLLKNKLSSLCGIMRRVSSFLPPACMKQMYFALIHSRLQYLVAVWGLACKSALRELQVIQNRCLKIVFSKPHLHPSALLYSGSGDSLLPIRGLCELQTLTQMHKIVKDPLLHHNTTLPRIPQVRTTRQAGNFALSRPNTEFGKKKFSYFGAKTYNSIPLVCKRLPNINLFRNAMREKLKQRIPEFLR